MTQNEVTSLQTLKVARKFAARQLTLMNGPEDLAEVRRHMEANEDGTLKNPAEQEKWHEFFRAQVLQYAAEQKGLASAPFAEEVPDDATLPSEWAYRAAFWYLAHLFQDFMKESDDLPVMLGSMWPQESRQSMDPAYADDWNDCVQEFFEEERSR